MRINQVVLIPAFSGRGTTGRYYGRYCEHDAVTAYFEPLVEHLENDGVIFQVQKEDEPIFPNSLVLHCSIGWDKLPLDKQKCNYSTVSYSLPQSKRVAEIIVESVSDWGKLYGTLSHKTKEVTNEKKNMLLKYEQTVGIYVEPFALNNALCEDYLKGAPVFGKMLAQAIFEFLWTRNEVPKMQSSIR